MCKLVVSVGVSSSFGRLASMVSFDAGQAACFFGWSTSTFCPDVGCIFHFKLLVLMFW